MKLDSYARFLKSDLYKQKVMDEMEGKHLQEEEDRKNANVEKKKVGPCPFTCKLPCLKWANFDEICNTR